MSKLVILKCTFPATVGYQSGKLYSYVTDLPEPDKATHAIVRDPKGSMALVSVEAVEEYKPQGFKMKHVVQLIRYADIQAQIKKPLA